MNPLFSARLGSTRKTVLTLCEFPPGNGSLLDARTGATSWSTTLSNQKPLYKIRSHDQRHISYTSTGVAAA
jgi:hypothetical protein